MVSCWRLSDSKSPQVSRALLSILADFNNGVVWVLSISPLISESSSPCSNPLVNVPRATTTISITVTFNPHIFFNSQARSWYLSFFSIYLIFTLWSAWTENFIIRQYYYYSLIRAFHWSLSDSKSPQVSRTLLSILAVLNNAVV